MAKEKKISDNHGGSREGSGRKAYKPAQKTKSWRTYDDPQHLRELAELEARTERRMAAAHYLRELEALETRTERRFTLSPAAREIEHGIRGRIPSPCPDPEGWVNREVSEAVAALDPGARQGIRLVEVKTNLLLAIPEWVAAKPRNDGPKTTHSRRRRNSNARQQALIGAYLDEVEARFAAGDIAEEESGAEVMALIRGCREFRRKHPDRWEATREEILAHA